MMLLVVVALCLLSDRQAVGMIHHLDFKGDNRMLVHLTSFGFGRGGNLTVSVTSLVPPLGNASEMGLTLDRSIRSQQSEILPSWDDSPKDCILKELKKIEKNESQVVIIRFNFTSKRLTIERRGISMTNLSVGQTPQSFIRPQPIVPSQGSTAGAWKGGMNPPRSRRSAGVPFFDSLRDSFLFGARRKKRGVENAKTMTATTFPAGMSGASKTLGGETHGPTPGPSSGASAGTLGSNPDVTVGPVTGGNDLQKTSNPTVKSPEFDGTVNWVEMIEWKNASGGTMYNASFTVRIMTEAEEGMYNLAFHNCDEMSMSMSIMMIEMNGVNYLSIGQAPLPVMYFIFFVVCLTLAVFWHWLLYVSREGVCKIHYLMLTLMYIKSVSILFHGINLQFMQNKGQKEEAFAILFYIVYLLKGIVMFLTIVLIGAGWTFVRHILSDRDKKIFVIVIPLQILVNVATIVVDESEQGMELYTMWKEIMIFLDLVCCGAILFPIVGSIRHLQQASQTDGKAAANLEKLKIFRHFYILVVCFIYFTRIIVLLVEITVPFRYIWLDQLFVEMATIGFFVLTGYKFRPASNNPYLRVSTSDDEDDEAESLTKNGALDSVTRVNIKQPLRSRSGDLEMGGGGSDSDGEEINQGRERADQPLIKQREASHEYD